MVSLFFDGPDPWLHLISGVLCLPIICLGLNIGKCSSPPIFNSYHFLLSLSTSNLTLIRFSFLHLHSIIIYKWPCWLGDTRRKGLTFWKCPGWRLSWRSNTDSSKIILQSDLELKIIFGLKKCLTRMSFFLGERKKGPAASVSPSNWETSVENWVAHYSDILQTTTAQYLSSLHIILIYI